ncbi:hypothetical protein ACXR8F_11710 [Terrabacter sp. AAH1]
MPGITRPVRFDEPTESDESDVSDVSDQIDEIDRMGGLGRGSVVWVVQPPSTRASSKGARAPPHSGSALVSRPDGIRHSSWSPRVRS